MVWELKLKNKKKEFQSEGVCVNTDRFYNCGQSESLWDLPPHQKICHISGPEHAAHSSS